MVRILIADFDKNIGRLLKSELESIGYVVDVVHQGTKMIVDSMVYAACDALLLNMQMPCLDYFNRLKRIKREIPSAHIIVLMNDSELQERAVLLDAGATVCFARHEISLLITYLRRIEVHA